MGNRLSLSLFFLSDRTKELRKLGFAGRRLGPVQMTTDTALNVTRRVVEDRGKFNEKLNPSDNLSSLPVFL
jgi:ribosome biogenesis SPOUT family RNA methylase Rps3